MQSNLEHYTLREINASDVKVAKINEFTYAQNPSGRNYSSTPSWSCLNNQFNQISIFNQGKEESQQIKNYDLVAVGNTDYQYDGVDYFKVRGEAKLKAEVPLNQMDDFFKKCQWLVKTKQVNGIKIYHNDPTLANDPNEKKRALYTEGKCTVLFYVENFHDRDDLERVRNIMVENAFILEVDETPVYKTNELNGERSLNEVVCRFPKLEVKEENRFGKISYRANPLSHNYI